MPGVLLWACGWILLACITKVRRQHISFPGLVAKLHLCTWVMLRNESLLKVHVSRQSKWIHTHKQQIPVIWALRPVEDLPWSMNWLLRFQRSPLRAVIWVFLRANDMTRQKVKDFLEYIQKMALKRRHNKRHFKLLLVEAATWRVVLPRCPPHSF